ncbi:unnamed protein product, partial [Effrenium voratum]
ISSNIKAVSTHPLSEGRIRAEKGAMAYMERREGYQAAIEDPLSLLEDDLLMAAEQQRELLRSALRSHRETLLQHLSAMDRDRASRTFSSLSGESAEEQVSVELPASPQHDSPQPMPVILEDSVDKSEEGFLDSPMACMPSAMQPYLHEALGHSLPPSPAPE